MLKLYTYICNSVKSEAELINSNATFLDKIEIKMFCERLVVLFFNSKISWISRRIINDTSRRHDFLICEQLEQSVADALRKIGQIYIMRTWSRLKFVLAYESFHRTRAHIKLLSRGFFEFRNSPYWPYYLEQYIREKNGGHCTADELSISFPARREKQRAIPAIKY